MATMGRWALDLKKKMGLWGHLEEEDLRLEGTFLSLAEKARRKLGVGPWPHGLRYLLGDPTQGRIWSDIQEPFLLADEGCSGVSTLGGQGQDLAHEGMWNRAEWVACKSGVGDCRSAA